MSRIGRKRRSRLAGSTAMVAAAVCLTAAGCSAAASGSQPATGQATAGQTASAAATGTGASGTGHLLSGAPAGSGFLSATAKVVPPDPLGPPADPFSGTPADKWADGAAGIAAPAAAAVGPYSKAQVAYAYQTTRKLLIAANLDKKTMLGGAPAAFASLLTAPQRTWFERNLNKKGVDKTGAAVSSRDLVMSFAPGSTQLIGSVIKVNGSMHAKAGRNSGGSELDIHVDYMFVYPVELPGQPDDWMRIVREVVWTVAFANWKGADSSFAPWVTTSGQGGTAGAQCGTGDGYSHPAYTNTAVPGASPSVTPSGTPQDPYVAGQSRVDGCQASTGT